MHSWLIFLLIAWHLGITYYTQITTERQRSPDVTFIDVNKDYHSTAYEEMLHTYIRVWVILIVKILLSLCNVEQHWKRCYFTLRLGVMLYILSCSFISALFFLIKFKSTTEIPILQFNGAKCKRGSENRSFYSLFMTKIGLYAINLDNILHYYTVRLMIQHYFKHQSIRSISFSCTSPIATKYCIIDMRCKTTILVISNLKLQIFITTIHHSNIVPLITSCREI